MMIILTMIIKIKMIVDDDDDDDDVKGDKNDCR